MAKRNKATPTITVIKNKKAPPRKTKPKSFYRDLIGSMGVGDLFVIDSKYHARFQTCGVTYARGRYSLYKHPENEAQYVFTIIK